MIRHPATLLALATASVLLTGCATDDSLPSRPRTASPLDPSTKAQQNAEQRSMEKPARDLPTSGGREFPGQSQGPAVADPAIVTLYVDPTLQAAGNSVGKAYSDYKIQGFSGPNGIHAFGNTVGPTTNYTRDSYAHILPALPPNPGTIPQTGSTPAPDGDYAIDHSWGQGLVLESAPHRDWPISAVLYKDTPVLHNPTYYFNLQEHEKTWSQNPGTRKGDWISTAIEVPWFYVNTAMLPLLMALEPPFGQRMTVRTSRDPNFLGHLPAGGDIIPAPNAASTSTNLTIDRFFDPKTGTIVRPAPATISTPANRP